jgi:oxygen-independent coproporphyrinogen-3 oxidase
MPSYVQALCNEVRQFASGSPEKQTVHTIFFGGGTPSLLPLNAFEQIFTTLEDCFTILPDSEISLEANPGTVGLDYLHGLRALGFNRVSMGMQSAQPDELRFLERIHDYFDVSQAVRWAREADFDDLSLDLIFGLPNQTLESWQENVNLALGMAPDHLSMYGLTVEHGTPLYHWVERGLVVEPDPDQAADMYEWAGERMGKAGFEQYEISNWARVNGIGKARTCRHNLQYWRNQPYVGFGAGAHSFIGGMRIANVLAPNAYITRLTEPRPIAYPRTTAAVNVTPIDRQTEMQETMMLGLRLVGEGVSEERFEARFGESMQKVFAEEIEELERKGLLEWVADGQVLRLSKAGRLLGNQVFMRFV